MVVSFVKSSEWSSKLWSVSEYRRRDLYGVGGSDLDLRRKEGGVVQVGVEEGEQSGVRGYFDLLGELKQ